jgi:hypothetical protein
MRHIRPQHVAVAAILAVAVALFAFSTEPWFGPENRFRVIMVAILLDTLVMVWLLSKYFELLAELRSQHKAASYVNTIRGMIAILAAAPANGERRRKVFDAIDEQFDLYDHTLGG